MAASTGKEQPPPYTSQEHQTSTTGYGAGPATTPVFYRTLSALAIRHSNNRQNSTITTSQYQEHTISIMVLCHGTFEPVVLGIDEEYGKLMDDFHRMLADPSASKKPMGRWITSMKVVWERSWGGQDLQLARGGTLVTGNNITAMLHLLKSRNGNDYIELS